MSGILDSHTGLFITTCGTFTISWEPDIEYRVYAVSRKGARLGIIAVPSNDPDEVLVAACQAWPA